MNRILCFLSILVISYILYKLIQYNLTVYPVCCLDE